jgi:hypothetical protein
VVLSDSWQVPVDRVVDHSFQWGSSAPHIMPIWGSTALRVMPVPPGSGIVHQVSLEANMQNECMIFTFFFVVNIRDL